LTRLLPWLRANARPALACASFAAMSAGFWLLSPALGLIIPGGIVFLALAWSHQRGA
jgi:hypothetical protein